MSTPTPQQPEAQARRSAERIEQQAGEMLKEGIFDRLVGQELPTNRQDRERNNVRRLAQSQLIASAAGNPNMPLEQQRQMVEQGLLQLTSNLGEDGAREAYGHIVLDRLEAVLEPQENPERIPRLQNSFEEVRGDIIPAERERIMDTAINRGFHIPRTPEEVERIRNDHPYFYVDHGILQVRSDIVHRHREALTGPPPLPGRAGEVMVECRQVLEELERADIASNISLINHNPGFEQPESVRRAINSVRMLFGLLFLLLAAVSLVMERNKPFPTLSAIYGGLAVLVLNPRIFSGRLRELRGQMEFVQSPQWDGIVHDNQEYLTGERGEDFIQEMTGNGDVRNLFNQVANGTMTSAQYYEGLEQRGVSDRHITFLRELEARNPAQWNYLLGNLRRVQSTDSQSLLAGFARDGMNIASLGQLPVPRPVPQPGTPSAAENLAVRRQFGGLGTRRQGA